MKIKNEQYSCVNIVGGFGESDSFIEDAMRSKICKKLNIFPDTTKYDIIGEIAYNVHRRIRIKYLEDKWKSYHK